MTNEVYEYEFRGGDNLKGMLKDYHHIMMNNELQKGEGAYKFSWAGTKKSGPSFGGNQMDLAHNKHGRKVLLDIVKNAVDDSGKPFLSIELIKKVEQILKHPSQMKGKSAAAVFGWIEVNKVDRTLSSKYGKQKTDEAYIEEMSLCAKKVEEFVAGLKVGPGKKFAESRRGKCYIFDYNNQYGLSIGGLLHKHLNGEKAQLDSGEIIPAFDKPEFTKNDFMRFLSYLKYYAKHAKDVVRRIRNIDDYLKRSKKLQEVLDSQEVSPISANECAKLYEAYMEYITYMTANSMTAFDSLTREFSRKYPNGSICEQCRAHGFDFDELFSKETADKL